MQNFTVVDHNKRAQEVHKANHKWWHDLETGEPIDRNKGELLMLVVSELAEAMEGERKDLMDDHLPHRKMAEVEMADAYIRLLDYAAGTSETLCHSTREVNEQVFETPDNKAEALGQIVRSLWHFDIESEEYYPSIEWCLIGVLAYCQKFNYDLEGAYHEKMAYNAQRADHKAEARKLKHGKKW